MRLQIGQQFLIRITVLSQVDAGGLAPQTPQQRTEHRPPDKGWSRHLRAAKKARLPRKG
jgi:hypothetical protein